MPAHLLPSEQADLASSAWGGTEPYEAAYASVRDGAFDVCTTRQVGLELELHLFDRSDLRARPSWSVVGDLVVAPPVLPGGSVVTVEPGGQVELSAPPAADLGQAVRMLEVDERALRAHCAARGLGLLAWGADPLREPRRVNPGERYVAMEEHFARRGCAAAAAGMMTATASLQVNLDTGTGEQAALRWQVLSALAPVLVAVSACSPRLGGRRSGWASMRQQQWHGLDAARTRAVGPVADGDGTAGDAWAAYALDAPLMLLADRRGGARPVLDGTTFGEWLRDPDRLGRAAGPADLAYHLTTLFPPIRPRGFVEVRCLDTTGPDWWPALAALVTTLAYDDDVAATVTGWCAGLPDLGTAGRLGLRHDDLHRASLACVERAAETAGEDAAPALARLAELVGGRRSPGDLVQQRVEQIGVEAAVAEALEVGDA